VNIFAFEWKTLKPLNIESDFDLKETLIKEVTHTCNVDICVIKTSIVVQWETFKNWKCFRFKWN